MQIELLKIKMKFLPDKDAFTKQEVEELKMLGMDYLVFCYLFTLILFQTCEFIPSVEHNKRHLKG